MLCVSYIAKHINGKVKYDGYSVITVVLNVILLLGRIGYCAKEKHLSVKV